MRESPSVPTGFQSREQTGSQRHESDCAPSTAAPFNSQDETSPLVVLSQRRSGLPSRLTSARPFASPNTIRTMPAARAASARAVRRDVDHRVNMTASLHLYELRLSSTGNAGTEGGHGSRRAHH